LADVQVMTSTTKVFHGDFLSRRFDTMALSQLISSMTASETASQHHYLAQAPLQGALAALSQDCPTPAALADLIVASTNLWMNAAPSSSSLHYDPHHNLLCVVTGAKTIELWPPACTDLLEPFPAFGQSPNHSQLRGKRLEAQLRKARRLAERQGGRHFKVVLRASDVLLIPAGWWHLVQSEPKAIAVNFWCQAQTLPTDQVRQHMRPYFARQHVREQAEQLVQASLQRLRRVATQHVRALSPGSGKQSSKRRHHGCSALAYALLKYALEARHSGRQADQARWRTAELLGLLLCDDARQMLAVLTALRASDGAQLSVWLMDGMSDACTEVFTTLLEGGWDAESVVAPCACRNWLASLESSVAEFQALQTELGGCDKEWQKKHCSIEPGEHGVQRALEHLYATLNEDVLARNLCQRKERLHEAAWQHVQECR
jgi:Cupin-like domain